VELYYLKKLCDYARNLAKRYDFKFRKGDIVKKCYYENVANKREKI